MSLYGAHKKACNAVTCLLLNRNFSYGVFNMTRFKKQLSAVTALTVGIALPAYAALPAAVASTLTGIESDMNALFGLVFPVVALGLGLMVVIKLFKRFGNKV